MPDTIAAISTALGESGIGIIRISGEKALEIAAKVFAPAGRVRVLEAESHRVVYGHVKDPEDGGIIDEALMIIMRAPRSYTREDTIELDCHGGYLPQKRVLEVVIKAGARLARPGEFTERAFLNGRLDLSQAEAVIDLIRSRTETSRQQALQQLKGSLSEKIGAIRSTLIDCLARIEANIDFPEDDIEETSLVELDRQLTGVLGELEQLLRTADAGKVIREGLATVIVGRPNVGKSSLLNTLLREERAIVTAVAGTTRDVIEEVVNIRGIPLRIADTAGIRETEDLVEKLGVERTKAALKDAELVVLVLSAGEELDELDLRLFEMVRGKRAVAVVNKIDLPQRLSEEVLREKLPGVPVVRMSLTNGIGLQNLEEEIVALVFKGDVHPEAGVTLTRLRHQEAVERAVQSLKEARKTIAAGLPLDFVSIDITDAAGYLGEITGETVREDVISEIFKQFCIGK